MNRIQHYLSPPEKVYLLVDKDGMNLFTEAGPEKYLVASRYPVRSAKFNFSFAKYNINIGDEVQWEEYDFEFVRAQVYLETKEVNGILLLDGTTYDVYYSLDAAVVF